MGLRHLYMREDARSIHRGRAYVPYLYLSLFHVLTLVIDTTLPPTMLTVVPRLLDLIEAHFILSSQEWDIEANQDHDHSPLMLGGVVRSKGFAWICGRDRVMGLWSSAGPMLSLEAEGTHTSICTCFSLPAGLACLMNFCSPFISVDLWLCEMPEDSLTSFDVSKVSSLLAHPHGDRRQEIVFICLKADHAHVTNLLDAALVTDDEWRDVMLPDPLPPWSGYEPEMEIF